MNEANMFAIAILSRLGIFVLSYVIVLLFVSLWHVFKKAGKPGWASIIPIYNILIWLDIAEKPRAWFFLLIIPVVNILAIIFINISVANKFGKSPVFGGLGLTFLSFIFYPILASPESKYLGSDDTNIDTSKINTLGLLLTTFLIFVFVSYPISLISGLVNMLTIPESAKSFYDIPSWSIWVNMLGSILFIMIATLIWKLKKLGVIYFIVLSVMLFLINIAVGHPFLFTIMIFLEPLVLFLLVMNKWGRLE